MYKILKIKTVLLICLAFIFKLLFVNIGAFASLETTPVKQLSDHHSSILKKRIVHEGDSDVKSAYTYDQLVQELTEESQESEEDDGQFKKATFLFALFSFLKAGLDVPKIVVASDRIVSRIQSKKFLVLSVIRI